MEELTAEQVYRFALQVVKSCGDKPDHGYGFINLRGGGHIDIKIGNSNTDESRDVRHANLACFPGENEGEFYEHGVIYNTTTETGAYVGKHGAENPPPEWSNQLKRANGIL